MSLLLRLNLGPGRIAWLAMVFLMVGCIADSQPGEQKEPDASDTSESEPLSIPIENVSAMAQLANDDVVVGNRKTGEIWRFSIDDLQPRLVADLQLVSEGQRGLLGMAIDRSTDEEKLFLSFTNPASDLIVGSIDLSDTDDGNDLVVEEATIVWSGFSSASGANGGHLEILPDGRLALGVGTLRNSSDINDPEKVNGKMLAIESGDGPDQTPEVLSSGWKNPFAFDVSPDGKIWVADNEPEDGSAERIGRGDRDIPASLIDIERHLAPGALVQLSADRLGLCSYLTGEMSAVELSTGVPSQPASILTDDCRTAALVLTDGRLLVSDTEQLRIKTIAGG